MDKKEEIMLAAYKHFARRGYNVSMADIAKEVGIKPPSIYSHFNGKDEIVYMLAEREVAKYNEFINRVHEENKDKEIYERLKNIFFGIVKNFEDNDKLRVWRNILLIDNEELRKKCSELVYKLEIYLLEKMEEVFGESIHGKTLGKEECEGNALLFLAMIQGALEGKLLCYGYDRAEEFIAKTWDAYAKGVVRQIEM